jgi:hypothetical protein
MLRMPTPGAPVETARREAPVAFNTSRLDQSSVFISTPAEDILLQLAIKYMTLVPASGTEGVHVR